MPVVAAVLCAGIANAASQPGATGPGAAPGGSQPGSTMPVAPPNSPAVLADQAAPSTDYGHTRPVPQQHYAAPINPGQLHAPAPVQQVAPVLAPTGTIRLGGFITPAPAWIPADVQNQINTTSANTESQVSTAARSVGITPARADRLAGGVAAGAGIGFLVGAVPGFLATASGGVLGGAVLGGIVGAVVIPIIGAVPGLVIGAALGAAAAGIPGGVVTGTAFGLVPGAILGGAAALLAP